MTRRQVVYLNVSHRYRNENDVVPLPPSPPQSQNCTVVIEGRKKCIRKVMTKPSDFCEFWFQFHTNNSETRQTQGMIPRYSDKMPYTDLALPDVSFSFSRLKTLRKFDTQHELYNSCTGILSKLKSIFRK